MKKISSTCKKKSTQNLNKGEVWSSTDKQCRHFTLNYQLRNMQSVLTSLRHRDNKTAELPSVLPEGLKHILLTKEKFPYYPYYTKKKKKKKKKNFITVSKSLAYSVR